MSLYDEQLASHPVWGSLGAAHQFVEQSRDKVADPEQIEIHARIDAVLTLLDQRLENVDAQFVYFAALENINSNLQQLSEALDRFDSDPGNRSYLDQADTQAAGILAYLAQLTPPTADDAENLREIGANYRQSMSGHMSRITTEFNALKEHVDQLEAQVREQEGRVSAEVDRLTQVAATAESEFSSAQDAREAEFELRASNAIVDPVTTATQRGDVALADLTERADKAWEEIEALKKRAEDASSYLGISALAAGYHDTADREDGHALWYSIGAIAALCVAVGAAATAVIWHVAEAFSLEGVLTKALVAVPLLVLAGYLARESSRHAERAHFNRQRQRQLESLPAYLDGVNEGEERSKLYETLAPGFFAPVVGGRGDKGDEQEVDPIAPLLGLILAELRRRDGG